MKVPENSRMIQEDSNSLGGESRHTHRDASSRNVSKMLSEDFSRGGTHNHSENQRQKGKSSNTQASSSSSRETNKDKGPSGAVVPEHPTESLDDGWLSQIHYIEGLADYYPDADEDPIPQGFGDEHGFGSLDSGFDPSKLDRGSLIRDTSEIRSPVEKQADESTGQDNSEPGSNDRELPQWQSQTVGTDILVLIQGAAMLQKYPAWGNEKSMRYLQELLYSKENSMKFNECFGASVGQQAQVQGKGPGGVDIPASIKLFRELYQIELSAVVDPFVKIENSEIKVQDLFRLLPMVFLNDSTINFYLKMVEKHLISPERANECLFFNTYFMTKLRNESSVNPENDGYPPIIERSICQQKVGEQHHRTRRWHKTFNLFDKTYIFFPVNKKEHWFSVIIANLPNLLTCIHEERHPQTLPPEKRPYILLLDPLSVVEDGLDTIVRMYLECEVMDKLTPEVYSQKVDPAGTAMRNMYLTVSSALEHSYLITESTIPHFQLIIPRQRNTYDCGVFMLEYIESFARDPFFILNRIGDSLNFCDWFPRVLIEQKRVHLIKFLINLRNQLKMSDCVAQLLASRNEVIEGARNDRSEFDKVNPEEYGQGSPSSEGTPRMDKPNSAGTTGSTTEGLSPPRTNRSSAEPANRQMYDMPTTPEQVEALMLLKQNEREKRRVGVRAYYSSVPKEILALYQYLTSNPNGAGDGQAYSPYQMLTQQRDNNNSDGGQDGQDEGSMAPPGPY